MKDFTIIPNSILRLHLSASEFLTYVTIKSFCWFGKVECYPTVKTLVEASGLSKKTINRSTQSLEAKGLIKVIYRKKSNGLNDSNVYILLPLKEDETEADQVLEEIEADEILEENEPEVNETEETEQKKSPSKVCQTNEEQSSHTLSISNIDSIREDTDCQAVSNNLEKICAELELSIPEIDLVTSLVSFSSLTCSHIILGSCGYSIQSIITKLETVTAPEIEKALSRFNKYQSRQTIKNSSAYLLSILMTLDTTNTNTNNTATQTKPTQKSNKAKAKNRFNNFNQRSYDFEELESKLANL